MQCVGYLVLWDAGRRKMTRRSRRTSSSSSRGHATLIWVRALSSLFPLPILCCVSCLFLQGCLFTVSRVGGVVVIAYLQVAVFFLFRHRRLGTGDALPGAESCDILNDQRAQAAKVSEASSGQAGRSL